MNTYLISGLVLGFSAGISPGPLLTLVIAQTLRHNFKEGFKVAIAPILTDIPIILVSIFVLSTLANVEILLGIVSLIGACFVLYLAYETFFQKPVKIDLSTKPPRSYFKGITTNLLSPHPYLFWITVGGPIIAEGYEDHLINPAFFIVSFFLMIVGSKLFLAAAVNQSRNFLSSNTYLYILKILGIALLIFAIYLFRDGLVSLGW